MCYSFTNNDLKVNALRYDLNIGALASSNLPVSEWYYADLEANTTAIENALLTEHAVDLWKDCCHKAVECCDVMLKRPAPEDFQDHCPQTWDAWSCYDYAKAETTAYQVCPNYVYQGSESPGCLRYSSRICENGTWRLDPKSNQERTNYVSCGNVEYEKIEHTYFMVWYIVSLVFLIVALLPFFLYRQLRVQRITIHKHLFIAMAWTCFFSILQIQIVLLGSMKMKNTVAYDNGPGCKILAVLQKYSVLSGHFWMLCEGIYLHQVITAAFKEQKSLKLFYLIGWGIPILPVSIDAIVRKVVSDEKCWAVVTNENIVWITAVPGFLCLLLNLIFLFNIIRVLVTKLRSVQTNEPAYFRKAVRATLFLIPLLGLHQLTSIIYPDFSNSECSSRHAYVLFQNTVLGSEGMLVSFLFCYLNGEVLYLLNRSYKKFRASHALPDLGSRFSFSTQVSTVPADHRRTAETRH